MAIEKTLSKKEYSEARLQAEKEVKEMNKKIKEEQEKEQRKKKRQKDLNFWIKKG